MTQSKLRRQIAREAARLIHRRGESRYERARTIAAWRVCRRQASPDDLPDIDEIRAEVQHLAREGTDDQQPAADELPLDRFEAFFRLLSPLEQVAQNPQRHPEGDALYHSLAGLEALAEMITPRTAWLIENLHAARRLREGTLGMRARRRLEASEDFDTLVLLADCDRLGRRRGVPTPDLVEALEYVRDLPHTLGH
jgi:hypothetical protein